MKISELLTEGLRPGEYHLAQVTFSDGAKINIRITSDEGFRDQIINHFKKQGKNVTDIKVDYSVRGVPDYYESVEEGLGKTLAGAALAGTMALSNPIQAQTQPIGNTQAILMIDGEQRVFDMGKMDVRQAAKMLEKSLEDKGITNYKASVSNGKQRINLDTVDRGLGMLNRETTRQ